MTGPSLLDEVKAMGAREARKKAPNHDVDRDYVKPTLKEMRKVYLELVALDELTPPSDFTFPDSTNKAVVLNGLRDIDPTSKVAERATLHRLLKKTKTPVPDPCPTADMVQLAMASGAFGRLNKKRTQS